jgi:precorrin-2/cobalt-factor-2 C20-methyltransferase
MTVTLYGVGVGPGAPDLITLRALDVARRVPVLALPRASDYGPSQAWRILEPTLGPVPGQERLFLTFPMSRARDPAVHNAAWDVALAAIGARLGAGQDVAFVSEGDPSLYSSFIYLAEAARERWPDVRVEVVPGVTSVTAVPAVAGLPLADGRERLAILPATYGVDDLRGVLRAFDTIVLMKIGGNLGRVTEALEGEGLIERAVLVSRATMAEQRIIRDLRTAREHHCDCFTMVVVARHERHGALAGKNLDALLEAVQ